MESWEVLELAIPRSASGRIAQMLNVCADYVRKWRREPESDDAPTASGQRSILDRVCDLIDAVFLVNPKGAGLIINFINAHYRNLLQIHTQPIAGSESKAKTISDLLTQATEAINRFNLEGCTNDTLRELVEARDAFAAAIEAVETTMSESTEESI
ncbi:MAG: hypothetical protein ABI539_08370 [Acidobacteriota bacterium]